MAMVSALDEPGPDGAGDRRRTSRLVASRVATALAGVLVLFALVAPDEATFLTSGAFLRIPVEGLIGVAVILALPARAVGTARAIRVRRVLVAVAGAALGLLTVVKALDLGFRATLDRPFDLVGDWTLLGSAVDFVARSSGRTTAVAAAVAVAVAAAAVVILLTACALRLDSVLVQVRASRRAAATRAVAAVGAAWIAFAALGVQIVPGVPVASHGAVSAAAGHLRQVGAGLRDRQAFAALAAADPFGATPGEQLLTSLRGRDVLVAFVESYGRVALEDPRYVRLGSLLDEGSRSLAAAGFASRSAWLTSPTAGGSSWLAHATLQSGLWIDTQQRYGELLSSSRLTLSGAFRRAGWRTVDVVPANNQDWPEAAFYGFDQIYDARNIGYRGPNFNFDSMPDQYTMSALHRLELARPARVPVMAEIDLLSSHAPWAPLPRLVDWKQVGDGSIYDPMPEDGLSADQVWPDADLVRQEYAHAVEYSMSTLISYVQTYGDGNLVLILLGDHQPAPIVAGEGAGRDVPVTIIARDRAVLDRISGWGWTDGLKPGSQAPLWRMDSFRDRFLAAFA